MTRPIAIVTGAGTGIGSACCRALAENGFCIGVHYRNSEKGARALLESIGDGFLIRADLADTAQVVAMVGEIKDKAGRVDVLVKNAGHSVTRT